jgi:holliday junction DNA helicase RuvA
MIGKLKGVLDSITGSTVLIDVGGVGYEVACSGRTLRALPELGLTVSLLIETQMREDAIHLYGFAETAEREWFRLLITVQGIGARVAQTILSTLAPEELMRALATGDKSMLTKAEGVGPKLAARMATELKDKASALSGPVTMTALKSTTSQPPATADHIMTEALSALTNLGYRRAEAYDQLLRVRQELPDAPLDRLIAATLQRMANQAA